MTYIEEKGNLFDVPNVAKTQNADDYVYIHCIASDYRMGAGIAVPMKKEFGLTEIFDEIPKMHLVHPTAVHTDGVINMITKELSNGKPKYEDFITSLRWVRLIVTEGGIKKIALPQIGCGIDGLSWDVVSALIKDFFKDIDVEIKVVIFDPTA